MAQVIEQIVDGSDVQIGDRLFCVGSQSYEVTKIEQYDHPTLGAHRMSHSHDGWTMTLFDGQPYRIVPR